MTEQRAPATLRKISQQPPRNPRPGIDAGDPGRGWTERYEALASRMRALGAAIEGSHVPGKPYETDCSLRLLEVVARLAEVNILVQAPEVAPWVGPSSAIMRYVSCAHVWCGDVAVGLLHLASPRASSGGEGERQDNATSAVSYVNDYLDPLLREVIAHCEACWTGHPLQRARTPIEHLHTEIVSLCSMLNP